jgi:hypothetical protein
MSVSVLLIAYLLVLYCLAMLFFWRSLWGQKQEPLPRREAHFALQEGQTILGVMDTTKIRCFCIGHAVMDEKSYE